jgi:hypothetical protein
MADNGIKAENRPKELSYKSLKMTTSYLVVTEGTLRVY